MTAARSFQGDVDARALAGRYLGPAEVLRAGAVLEASLPGGEVIRPRLALAYAFVPAPGDSLLVIGEAERFFVIGVLASAGRTELRFRGDVDLRASGGTLELSGEHGVSVEGPRVDIRAKHLSVVADRVTEAFGTVLTRVKSLLSVHTGETAAVVHGEWSTRSDRAAITSREVVSVNGKEVHLG